MLAFGWFWNPQGWYTDNPNPLPWWHPQVGERFWSPLKVTHNPDGTQSVSYGKAWEEFEAAAARWLE